MVGTLENRKECKVKQIDVSKLSLYSNFFRPTSLEHFILCVLNYLVFCIKYTFSDKKSDSEVGLGLFTRSELCSNSKNKLKENGQKATKLCQKSDLFFIPKEIAINLCECIVVIKMITLASTLAKITTVNY